MSSLAERIRAAREQWRPAGGHDWLLRRPTRLQIADHAGDPRAIVFASVVSWKITETELGVPGGSGRIPEFDPEAFREYVSDRLELLMELADHVRTMVDQHRASLEDAEKN